MKTRHSRQLEGILCVEKPQDWTSFDVVAKMRGIDRKRTGLNSSH